MRPNEAVENPIPHRRPRIRRNFFAARVSSARNRLDRSNQRSTSLYSASGPYNAAPPVGFGVVVPRSTYVAMMRQLLDVVNQAVEFPLPVHLVPSACVVDLRLHPVGVAFVARRLAKRDSDIRRNDENRKNQQA